MFISLKLHVLLFIMRKISSLVVHGTLNAVSDIVTLGNIHSRFTRCCTGRGSSIGFSRASLTIVRTCKSFLFIESTWLVFIIALKMLVKPPFLCERKGRGNNVWSHLCDVIYEWSLFLNIILCHSYRLSPSYQASLTIFDKGRILS